MSVWRRRWWRWAVENIVCLDGGGCVDMGCWDGSGVSESLGEDGLECVFVRVSVCAQLSGAGHLSCMLCVRVWARVRVRVRVFLSLEQRCRCAGYYEMTCRSGASKPMMVGQSDVPPKFFVQPVSQEVCCPGPRLPWLCAKYFFRGWRRRLSRGCGCLHGHARACWRV